MNGIATKRLQPGVASLATRALVLYCVLVSLGVACGRTPLPVEQNDEDAAVSAELCNGLDDDHDRKVDEDFRDEAGRYIADTDCGECGHGCDLVAAHATRMACGLLDEVPLCVARSCDNGYEVSRNGRCVSLAERLCMPCASSTDCGPLERARCSGIAGEQRCTLACDTQECPDGFVCAPGENVCLPESGDCSCDADESFELACALTAPNGDRCPGRQTCMAGRLTQCDAGAEACDEVDNDCDGLVDETFRDARGVYSLDLGNCGACGIDCRSAEESAGVALACAGDPFAPSCVVFCPDAANGVQPGDRLDANREIGDGCECTVSSSVDGAGQLSGEPLDSNCDGADGDVLHSYYVANDGDDDGPGSVTRPLKTISRALELAAASQATDSSRTHVFVASGTYAESLTLPNGVAVHGGYRRDFLALDPDAFETRVVATRYEPALGAALRVGPPGPLETLAEGLHLRGFDGVGDAAPAVGLLVPEAYPELTLRRLAVQSGRPTAGRSGTRGAIGRAPDVAAASGDPPRAALEDSQHLCRAGAGAVNVVAGGAGGRNTCAGQLVAGGSGGGSGCPDFEERQAGGGDGVGVGAGPGGQGGTDLRGPTTSMDMDTTCFQSVCCGLADFVVPTMYLQAAPGAEGAAGQPGAPGATCTDPLGEFAVEPASLSGEGVVASSALWAAGLAAAGSGGTPGGGGGGGGAGGGVVMRFIPISCEFPDGLGGGGGGGGAGGCGGEGGLPGESGGPAVGILVFTSSAARMPRLAQLQIVTDSGAAGGDGGSGGDGGPGGAGGLGGQIARALLSTPTLAGAAPGEPGGNGCIGGPGGAAGGGCGGSSVGIWVNGSGGDSTLSATLRASNSFAIGLGGRPGRGGGGARPAENGVEGMAIDVLVR